MNPENISTIANRLIPEVKLYLDQLIRARYWVTEQYYDSYALPPEVRIRERWPYFEVFCDYLIRREFCRVYGIEARDDVAEIYSLCLEEFDQQIIPPQHRVVSRFMNGRYIIVNYAKSFKLRRFLDSYEIYRDTNEETNHALLIHIFNTAMINMMFNGKATIEFSPGFANWNNINDIFQFVRSWFHHWSIIPNHTVHGGVFIGEAGLILDDFTIMDIIVTEHEPGFIWPWFVKIVYKMIFWALGYFRETGIRLSRFKVYNPLKGKVYILDISHFRFEPLVWILDNRLCWA